MFDQNHYVPILKGKEAEYSSLKNLSDKYKKNLTPLWEIPTIPWDYQVDAPAKTIDEHLDKLEKRILGAWMFHRPSFIDLSNIYEEEVMKDDSNPLDFVFDQARKSQLQLIPVSGLNRGDKYQSAVYNAHKTDKLGVCLRIGNEDFEDIVSSPNDKAKQISELLKKLKVKPAETDIILDFSAITDNQSSSITITSLAILTSFPMIKKWRSLTLTSSGFPKDLSNIQRDSVAHLPRIEWQVWKNLYNNKNLPRIPTFGDYAINHPIHSEVDPRLIMMSAGLRYTIDDSWLVFKGRNIKQHGSEQFNDFCSDLIKMPEYKGKKFSWGDKEIDRMAHDVTTSGNATTWRRIGFNHHFAMVVSQLSNLSDS